MTRDLLLLRSGKAARGWDGPKRKRPLRDAGKRQVQRIGVWLAEHDLVPARVVTATTERAVVSAQKALKAGGMGAQGIRRDRRLDGAKPAGALDALRDFGAEGGLGMLVLDRKMAESLLGHLLPVAATDLGTGCMAHLRLPDDWSALAPGAASLVDLVRPEDLPEKFLFDGPDGREWRDRPAYYYRQSAVLPYRQGEKGPELLLIRSSKRNHWVVPKGIHDPGYSAQDSAAHEAEEEAGILGEVAAEPLGRYEVAKWGATCTVTVYPMKVTRVLGEDRWKERHRTRIWASPEQAVARLRDDGLRALVAAFASASRR
ncbi:NUDIX domain-containing protein [Tropicimonas sediminicola]|uniref:Phosphohistidine phosphatase n=1 Tax=Tropicimonas sediminicola TaxID=1031541 RepID=A0A239LDG9_9RHOB|nr:NUDIX domain-containing protein [Tropicimonas sediminicola]SNT27958.1 phosphohistidine phosphatase [Tropicimonas sediminicola]